MDASSAYLNRLLGLGRAFLGGELPEAFEGPAAAVVEEGPAVDGPLRRLKFGRGALALVVPEPEENVSSTAEMTLLSAAACPDWPEDVSAASEAYFLLLLVMVVAPPFNPVVVMLKSSIGLVRLEVLAPAELGLNAGKSRFDGPPARGGLEGVKDLMVDVDTSAPPEGPVIQKRGGVIQSAKDEAQSSQGSQGQRREERNSRLTPMPSPSSSLSGTLSSSRASPSALLSAGLSRSADELTYRKLLPVICLGGGGRPNAPSGPSQASIPLSSSRLTVLPVESQPVAGVRGDPSGLGWADVCRWAARCLLQLTDARSEVEVVVEGDEWVPAIIEGEYWRKEGVWAMVVDRTDEMSPGEDRPGGGRRWAWVGG